MVPPNLIARFKLLSRIAAARHDGDEEKSAQLTAELNALQSDTPVQRSDGRLVGQMESRRPKWKRGKP